MRNDTFCTVTELSGRKRNECRVKHHPIKTEIISFTISSRSSFKGFFFAKHLTGDVFVCVCGVEGIFKCLLCQFYSFQAFIFFFVSSGMDSNSQTSQELLIPNDVRPSNSKVWFFFISFLVLFVFSHLKNKEGGSRKSVFTSHVRRHRSRWLQPRSSPASPNGEDAWRRRRHDGNSLIILIILTPD